MAPSLLFTNTLFCGLATLFLLPLLKHPNTLTYRKGIPIFIIVGAVLLKLLFPYEFTFTRTLASKNILPVLTNILRIKFYKDIIIGDFLLWIWLLISMLLFLYLIVQHRMLKRILSVVSPAKDKELNAILSELCTQKEMKKMPKIIQLDHVSSPFIIGFHSPVIVLPTQLSKSEIKLILMHELEHLIHNHLLIKRIIEITTVLHWWNPIIWLLRKELLRALELQADMNVIKELSSKDSLTYLETLISISRKASSKIKVNLSLSFALKNSMVVYRVSTILESNYFQKKKKSFIHNFCLSFISILFLLFPIMYTFEPYYPLPSSDENILSINAETDYFILREDKFYDLYIDGAYVVTFDNKPEDFSNLKVY